MSLLAALPAAPASALKIVPDKTYVPDGPVLTIARSSGTVYIGGGFTKLAPRTGPGVAIPTPGSSPDLKLPQVSGGGATVSAVAPDGSGGWYVAGSFTHVLAATRMNIAHIRGDKTLDPNFNPNANGSIRHMTVSGDTVYVSGDFTSVGGQQRNHLAALDATTGAATSFAPQVGVTNTGIAVSGSTVYAFTGDYPNFAVSALDASSGAPIWSTPVNGGGGPITVSGANVYVAGVFTQVGGQARNYMAALNASDGSVTAWDPHPDNYVSELKASGSSVYAGGSFTSIGGQQRNSLAELDPTSGAATSWDPNVTSVPSGGELNTPDVYSIAISGTTMYIGGTFNMVGGQRRDFAAALDASTGVPTSWNPQPWDIVNAVAATDSAVYVGGRFGAVGPGIARNNAAALGVTSGTPTSWNPNPDEAVNELIVSGSTVYAGGRFTSIGGKTRNRIAALSASTGAATGWNPNADNDVNSLAISGSTVYAGGYFNSIGGLPRSHLAALDATTGNAKAAWNPSPDGAVDTLTVSGSTVYAGGTFTIIGLQPRHDVAAIDASNGLATPWNPNPDEPVDSIVPAGSLVYVGGRFSQIGLQTRHQIAALNASSGLATGWNPDSDGFIKVPGIGGLGLIGSTIYAGGTFSHIGGKPRESVAGIDTTTGKATTWNPGVGGYVYTLLASPSDGRVYVGGWFGTTERAAQQNFAVFSP